MVSFNPPLGETTILNIPFHDGQLTFTAAVGDGELDARATIQIWTDIPDNSEPSINRRQQDWSPRSFQFRQNSSVASLSIPFLDFIHPSRSQFAFTYRILHPDGQVQWLGDYGKNGALIVNRYDDRLVLFGDWSTSQPGHLFTPKSAIKSPLQVFSLSDDIQWRCWDLSSSVPRLLSGDDGPSHIHSALLVPSQSRAAIVPLAPIFLTSQDVQVTIHPNARSVYVTSPSRGGLLSLQTLSPDALIASLSAALPSVVSIPDPDTRHAILLAYPDRSPSRLFVIPLSADASASAPSMLSLPLSTVLSRVQSLSNAPSPYFSVSNPTRFISTSADQLQLSIPDFGGAQFSLSPVYDLVKPEGDVRLSLTSKHNRIPNNTGHNLLTPPPSPPLNPTETETQSSRSPVDDHELADQVPAVHVHHVDDQASKPIEPVLTSGKSVPDTHAKDQLGSGQTTPKPRRVANPPRNPTPITVRLITGAAIRKLIYFVLRILAFYARILSRVILTVLSTFNVPKREPVATPRIRTVELDDDRAEIKPTSVSSAIHTPTLLTPGAGTPRARRSGTSTPLLHKGALDSSGQSILGVAETLEAVATKIIPEFTAKVGEEKPQEDLGGSYVREDPDFRSEKSDHTGKWEIVHWPGVVFELTALPSPLVPTEGTTSPKIKPIRLTLDGAEGVVKGIKYYLDDVELTDVKLEPLNGTGQEGLWAVEIPRMNRDLATLRIF